MSLRPRHDPFAEVLRLRVPGRRPRLDRAGGAVTGLVEPAVAPALVRIEAPACLVLAVADCGSGALSAHDTQILGAARQLADSAAGAVVLLAAAEHEAAGTLGADRIAVAPGLAADSPEQRAAAVASVIGALQPSYVLFAESLEGGDLARRVAVLTGLDLTTEIEALSPRAAIRPTRAGRFEQHQPPSLLLCLQPGSAQPYAGSPHATSALDCPEADLEAPSGEASLVPGDPATMTLPDARFVVAAGNGVRDFGQFRALAAALGATPGASRIVCDAGLMPRSCQVGASGTVLAAEIYLALGISGAPQHLQGVGAVPHIVAVNTDLHAAMVERADLAIIADAHAVSEALLALLAPPGPFAPPGSTA